MKYRIFFIALLFFITKSINSAEQNLIPQEPSLIQRIEKLPEEMHYISKQFLIPDNILHSPELLAAAHIKKYSIDHDKNDSVNHVIISPDSKLIVSFSDNIAKITDLNTGKLLNTINDLGHVNYAKIKSDSKVMATLSESENTIKISDLYTGELLNTTNFDYDIDHLEINPDFTTVVTWTVNNDAAIKISDLHTGELLNTIKLESKFDITPDSRFIVTWSGKTAKITNLLTGELLRDINYNNNINMLTITPDSRFIVSWSDKTVQVIDYNSGNLVDIIEYKKHIFPVKISSKIIISGGSRDNTLNIYDLNTRQKTSINFEKNEYQYLSSTEISPDSRFIVTIFDRLKTMKIIDLTTGRLLYTLKLDKAFKAIISADSRFISIYFEPDDFEDNSGMNSVKIIDFNTPDYFKDLNFLQLEFISWLYTQKSQNIVLHKPNKTIKLDDKQKEIFKSLPEVMQKNLVNNYKLSGIGMGCIIL